MFWEDPPAGDEGAAALGPVTCLDSCVSRGFQLLASLASETRSSNKAPNPAGRRWGSWECGQGLTQAHPACLPWSAQRPGPPPHGLSPPPWAPASAGGSLQAAQREGVRCVHPCSFPGSSSAFQNMCFRTQGLLITLAKWAGLLPRWAWVGSRHSHFITFVTLATPTPLGTLSPYLFNGSKNPTWLGCCGAQSR